MKAIQMTLDEELIEAVDKAVRELHTTRSAFTRKALHAALKKERVSLLERRHREGYERQPVGRGEFSVWEPEQDWGDE